MIIKTQKESENKYANSLFLIGRIYKYSFTKLKHHDSDLCCVIFIQLFGCVSLISKKKSNYTDTCNRLVFRNDACSKR